MHDVRGRPRRPVAVPRPRHHAAGLGTTPVLLSFSADIRGYVGARARLLQQLRGQPAAVDRGKGGARRGVPWRAGKADMPRVAGNLQRSFTDQQSSVTTRGIKYCGTLGHWLETLG